MRLKKKVKRTLLFILMILLLGGSLYYLFFYGKRPAKKSKVINTISKYGYELKDSKPEAFKEEFANLKKILSKKDVDEESYAKSISKLFVIDFYSLNDKLAKTDVGGSQFVSNSVKQDFLEKAENTYYKYLESNIYGNRNEELPIVTEAKIESIEKAPFTYGDNSDEEAYKVNVSWKYNSSSFSSYQKKATIILVHEDNKLVIVEEGESSNEEK